MNFHDISPTISERQDPKLKFVAPMPEQIGTTTVHFPEARLKFAITKVGRTAPILMTFWSHHGKCILVVSVCSGMGATNSISRGPTNFRSWTKVNAWQMGNLSMYNFTWFYKCFQISFFFNYLNELLYYSTLLRLVCHSGNLSSHHTNDSVDGLHSQLS